MIYKCLTIAGSDSGGCAGIQADIKTMSACGVFAMSAITALTFQNTLGVSGVEAVSPEGVEAQIDAIFCDMGADAVKSGMLFSREIIESVASKLKEYKVEKYVLDPVMISASGSKLLKDDAVKSITEKLLPLSLIVTPNAAEAEVLSGINIKTRSEVERACKIIFDKGARNVLIKGGHLDGDNATDTLYNGETFKLFSSKRIDTKNIHGSGCTYAAAIASFLAKGLALDKAVAEAKNYVAGAIASGALMDIGGGGPGPLDHFHNLRDRL